MGALGDAISPATAYSPIGGADVRPEAGVEAALPLDVSFEHALVLIEGEATVHDRALQAHTHYDIGDERRELSQRRAWV